MTMIPAVKSLGMAIKRLGSNGVLEVVFAEDVPAGGIVVGDTVKFKFFYKGQPLQNTQVNASYGFAAALIFCGVF
jgi:uncharacterized GH25 family protein